MTLNSASGQKTEAAPLYLRIERMMRERIARGDWAVGQPLPSRVRLCAEFGTTRVTLDKALQGLVRSGLLCSTRGRGTFIASSTPQANATDVTKPRILRIGILMGREMPVGGLDKPDMDNYYFGPLFQGIREAVAGQPIEIAYARPDQSDYAGFYRENALDGILLITPLLNELPTLHALADAQVPCVAVGVSSHSPADSALAVVDSDNRQGACDAVQYLLGLGHRRIALVNLATSQANHHDRLEGYRHALARTDARVDLGDLLLYPIHEAGRLDDRIEAWVAQALRGPNGLPTAILACDYLMALATMRVLRRSGLRVPEDVSVVGFDDPFSAEHLTPPLTTVRQPVYGLGRRSAERLLDALRAGRLPCGAEILPIRLIVRSSACPPLHDSPVSLPRLLTQTVTHPKEKEGIRE